MGHQILITWILLSTILGLLLPTPGFQALPEMTRAAAEEGRLYLQLRMVSIQSSFLWTRNLKVGPLCSNCKVVATLRCFPFIFPLFLKMFLAQATMTHR